MEINYRDLRFFMEIVSKRSGLNLDLEKKGMLIKRLQRLLELTHYKTFPEFLSVLEKANLHQIEIREVFNFITTQETYFFRLPFQFRYLFEELFPRFNNERKTRLNILSAGCATGEEAYTLAILLHEWNELYPEKAFKWEITAVDISEKAIELAKSAAYTHSSVHRITQDNFVEPFLAKYFEVRKINNQTLYQVPPYIIQCPLKFSFMNLLDGDRHFMKSYFDLVFFRNVLIYMKQEARKRVCDSLHESMVIGGTLFLGETETPTDEKKFEMHFQKNIYFFTKNLV